MMYCVLGLVKVKVKINSPCRRSSYKVFIFLSSHTVYLRTKK